MPGQTRAWWLEDVSLRRLDPAQRRALAGRNRSAAYILKGLGERTPDPLPQDPYERQAVKEYTRGARGAETPTPQRNWLHAALLHQCEGAARSQGRDAELVLRDELERASLVFRVLAWLIVTLYLLAR